jgi:hypothetical protein
VNIKFCFKAVKTAIETFQLLKQAYSDNTISPTWFLNGMQEFWTTIKISKLMNAVVD